MFCGLVKFQSHVFYLLGYERVEEGNGSDPHDFNSPAEQSKGGDPIKDETNQSSVESLTQLMWNLEIILHTTAMLSNQYFRKS